MIQLSNKHSFEYIAASGALAYDGNGWPWEWPFRLCGLIDPSLMTVVTKTLTYAPRKGNLRWYKPWACVKLIKNGVLNAVGLTNPGLDWWIKSIGMQKKYPTSLVVSIMEEDYKKLKEMVLKLNSLPLVGIEINTSCPNTGHDLTSNAHQVIENILSISEISTHPLLLKLSYVQDYLKIAKALEGVVEAIALNTVPWSKVFPHQASPLAHLGGGGLSGEIIQKYNWEMIQKISTSCSIPVIASSVMNAADIQTVRTLGAKAISFGSLFIKTPWKPTALIRQDLLSRLGTKVL